MRVGILNTDYVFYLCGEKMCAYTVVETMLSYEVSALLSALNFYRRVHFYMLNLYMC